MDEAGDGGLNSKGEVCPDSEAQSRGENGSVHDMSLHESMADDDWISFEPSLGQSLMIQAAVT